MKTARQILQEARDYVAVPGQWVRGITVMYRGTQPRAMCAGAAIAHCAGVRHELIRAVQVGDKLSPEHQKACEVFARHSPSYVQGVPSNTIIIGFNDGVPSVSCILDVFDAAIASLEPPQTDIEPLRKLLEVPVKELEPA